MDARIKSARDEEHAMPMIDADGCLLNVAVEGRQSGPTLMLSNSLGSTMQMWEPQMKALTQMFRVIRYDRRGHGKSGAPPGPYSMARFGRDVLAGDSKITAHLGADKLTQLFEPMAYQGVSQALIDRLLASLDDQ